MGGREFTRGLLKVAAALDLQKRSGLPVATDEKFLTIYVPAPKSRERLAVASARAENLLAG